MLNDVAADFMLDEILGRGAFAAGPSLTRDVRPESLSTQDLLRQARACFPNGVFPDDDARASFDTLMDEYDRRQRE